MISIPVSKFAFKCNSYRYAKKARLKAFRSVSVSTLRLQQLQSVFLDLPIVPKKLQGLFLNRGGGGDDANNANASAASSAAAAANSTVADLPDAEWFDVVLPSDGGGVVKNGFLGAVEGKESATKKELDNDLTPAFVEYDGERLPGEFSIPVVPYPFVCHPGSQVGLDTTFHDVIVVPQNTFR
jgi:hypothetical protein